MRKMVLLKWSVGAVGAGSVPGGAVGGARFGVLCLGEGCVPNRDYVGRSKVPVAGEGNWGWREAGWASEDWAPEGCAWAPPWHVAGDGAPRRKVSGEVFAF